MPPGERDSGMSISLSLTIGYQRRRPNTQGDRWEARFDSIGLLVAGAIVAILILIFVLPRLLAWLGGTGP